MASVRFFQKGSHSPLRSRALRAVMARAPCSVPDMPGPFSRTPTSCLQLDSIRPVPMGQPRSRHARKSRRSRCSIRSYRRSSRADRDLPRRLYKTLPNPCPNSPLSAAERTLLKRVLDARRNRLSDASLSRNRAAKMSRLKCDRAARRSKTLRIPEVEACGIPKNPCPASG